MLLQELLQNNAVSALLKKNNARRLGYCFYHAQTVCYLSPYVTLGLATSEKQNTLTTTFV